MQLEHHEIVLLSRLLSHHFTAHLGGGEGRTLSNLSRKLGDYCYRTDAALRTKPIAGLSVVSKHENIYGSRVLLCVEDSPTQGSAE